MSGRLRRVDCSAPGLQRRRRGRGFEYVDQDGVKVEEPEVLERIGELVIPPAWKDVWVCLYPMGHIQATGIDARGRKQYLYHRKWRERRDQEKFDSMVHFARALPQLRKRVSRDLARDEVDHKRVLACSVRLLDRGFFRIGGEDYAESNDSYGLATMRKDHVTLIKPHVIGFDYPGKSGRRREQSIVDPVLFEIITALKRRRGGGDDLLAYKAGARWTNVRSEDINGYIKSVVGDDFSAKAFRTWNATVLAAVALAVSAPAARTKTARKRAVTRAIEEVAHYLGNTPAVCRASYIDPRVFDRFAGGVTISGVLPHLGDEADDLAAVHGRTEKAVLELLNEDDDSPRIEAVEEVEALAA